MSFDARHMFALDTLVLDVVTAGGGVVAAGAGGLDWAKAVTMTTDESNPPSRRLERMRDHSGVGVPDAVGTRREEFLFHGCVAFVALPGNVSDFPPRVFCRSVVPGRVRL